MRPVELPAVRDAVIAGLFEINQFAARDPGQHRVAGDRQAIPVQLDAEHLRAAELFWVTSPMLNLAKDVAEREIAETRWLQEDRPSGCGLLVCPDGEALGRVPVPWAKEVTGARAVSWGPGFHGLYLAFWIDRDDPLLANRGTRGRRHREFPPLLPGWGCTQPVEIGYRPLATATKIPLGRAVLATVQAAWLLMDMPGIAEHIPIYLPQTSPIQQPRGPHREPDVVLIDIRRPRTPDHPEAEPTGRHYRHRWYVRPHRRWQPYGPGHTLRKRILIDTYIKGPAGAPLIGHERVTVWRR